MRIDPRSPANTPTPSIRTRCATDRSLGDREQTPCLVLSATARHLLYCSARAPVPCARCTAGGFQLPSPAGRIEGGVVFGQ